MEQAAELQFRLAGIVKETIVDGPGLRLTVYVQGCTHHCPGCHNPHTHSIHGGMLESIDAVMEAVTSNPLLDGITLSGGEPFLQPLACAELARRAKAIGLHVMTYTGFTFERITAKQNAVRGWRELLENTDILADGRFLLHRRNLLLRFRGSDNQRLIDVAASLRCGTTVVMKEDFF